MEAAINYSPNCEGSEAGLFFVPASQSKRPLSVGSNPGATFAGTQAEFTVEDVYFMGFKAATPEVYEQRFWSYVDKSGECWMWLGGGRNGYGAFSTRTNNVETSHYAHRYAYEITKGPIPEGKTLDHLCHNRDESCPGGSDCPHRKCVRPDHVEPASNIENVMRGKSPAALNARKTHCVHRHEFTAENTIDYNGVRLCRACRKANSLRRHKRVQ